MIVGQQAGAARLLPVPEIISIEPVLAKAASTPVTP